MSGYLLRTDDTWHLNDAGGRTYSSTDLEEVARFALDGSTSDTVRIVDGKGKTRYILCFFRAFDGSLDIKYNVRCGECSGLKQVPKSEVVLP